MPTPGGPLAAPVTRDLHMSPIEKTIPLWFCGSVGRESERGSRSLDACIAIGLCIIRSMGLCVVVVVMVVAEVMVVMVVMVVVVVVWRTGLGLDLEHTRNQHCRVMWPHRCVDRRWPVFLLRRRGAARLQRSDLLDRPARSLAHSTTTATPPLPPQTAAFSVASTTSCL